MSFILITVGNDDYPADYTDVADVRRSVRAMVSDTNLSMITHHAVNFQKFESYPDTANVYQIGTQQHPSCEAEIRLLQEELAEAKREKRPIVWNHRIKVEQIKLKQE